MDQFAHQGLRTLCYSYKILEESEYTNWLKEYEEMCYMAAKDKSLEPKLDEIIDKKNNSIDDFYLNASNQKLKKNIIKENNKNILNENLASFELRKSDLYLNDENESMNSFGSLNSSISKNSNFKNLINV